MSFSRGKCIRPVGLLSTLIRQQTGPQWQSVIIIVPFCFAPFHLFICFLYFSLDSSTLRFFHCVLFINHSFASASSRRIESRHSCKMHLALIKCAASPLFVISGRSGAQIKSAVQLQIPSSLRLQSIAFLLHSIPDSAFSFPKSPLTGAALHGPENEPRWWLSHSHHSHCSVCVYVCVCLSLCMWSLHALLLLLPECVADWFDVCVCVRVSVGVWCNVTSVRSVMEPHRLCLNNPHMHTHTHTHTHTKVQQVGCGCQSGSLRVK